jgi:hypothetical protein
MLKRSLVILLLSTSAAAASEISVNLAGVGGRTCAFWLSSQEHKSEGRVWIYGFWSGLNYVAAASEQNQSKATSDAMVSAVEQACRRYPSRVLAAAAWSAYLDLNKQ